MVRCAGGGRGHAVQLRPAGRACGKTRPLGAGTIVGSGTIANEDTSKGASCFAEQRVVETLRDGKPSTPFMSFGDVVRIEMLDAAGNSIFGAIEQRIEQAAKP